MTTLLVAAAGIAPTTRCISGRSRRKSRTLRRLRPRQSASSVLVLVVVVMAAFLVADQREGTLHLTEVLEVAFELLVLVVVAVVM